MYKTWYKNSESADIVDVEIVHVCNTHLSVTYGWGLCCWPLGLSKIFLGQVIHLQW